MSHWLYSGIIMVAIGVATWLMRKSQSQLSLRPWEKFGIGLGAFCGAMIGAKLPFVFSEWKSFVSGVAWFSDGKTILLGLVGGYAGVEIAKWTMNLRAKTGDTFAVPVAVAIAIGRIGCFVGGCCYGTPTDRSWGVVFPSVDSLPRHPTQLYETLFHSLAAIMMSAMIDRKWFQGNVIKLYIMMYAAYRFLTEWIRPEVRMLGALTAYQWASLVILAGFGWLWWNNRRGTNSIA